MEKFLSTIQQIPDFVIKWTKLSTWKDLIIPENPKEHTRMIRFLCVVLILVFVMIFIVFIITFSIARKSTPTVRVPSVTELDMLEASAILQSEKLQPHFDMVYSQEYDKYTIIKQNPNPGSSVRIGRMISLTVSLGQDKYTVPKLTDLSKDEAIDILEQERIPYSVQVVPAGKRELDKVIATSVPIGEIASRDTILIITITDSIQANQYRMNNFIRQPLEFAATTLYNNGITPIISTTNVDSLSDEGLVIAQNVSEGTILQKNTSAILTVGLYAYNEGDREKQKWHFFNYSIPRVQGSTQQIIATNEDGTLVDISNSEQRAAKYYRAVVEDELGRTSTIYERMGAEGMTITRVFKAYGRAKVYVYADDEIINSKNFGK